MAKLKLDLHDIYNRGDQIDAELNRIVEEAIDRKIELVEIIWQRQRAIKEKGSALFESRTHQKALPSRGEG